MLFDVPAIVPLALSVWQTLFAPLSPAEGDRPQTAFPGHQLFQLNDGSSLPSPAFGVGSVHKFENVTDLVLSAFSNGYRSLDTAPFYQTEQTAGLAIAASGVAREALYIVTKWDAMHGQDVRKELEASLSKLGTSYVDGLLIHFPQLATNLTDIWRQFEEVVDQGLARSISVSNFNETVLDGLLEHARIKPAVNQIRYHAYNVDEQAATLTLCKKHGIIVQAYSALTPITTMPNGPVDVVAEKIARRLSHDTGLEITPGQATLNWLRTKGIAVVTTSARDERQKEQLVPFADDFPLLTPAEIKEYEQFSGWSG